MTARLRSDHGWVDFDAGSGFVTAHGLGPGFGPVPYKVDVDDWRLRFPGRPLEGVHDILGFGYWYRRPGKTSATYEPPVSGERG